jgi:23S rRNA (uracil1939-C5)-methyltransferase
MIPPKTGDRIELDLEAMAQGGEAVGRWKGQVIFVQGGLPGEVVAVRLTEQQRSFARGVVEQVLHPSADRVRPRCPLFGRCGGCDWQHSAYPAQVVFKQAIVTEQCRHLGRVAEPPVAATLAMAEPWGYRSTVELHLSPAGRVGYYAARSHEVVPLEACPLWVPALNDLLPTLQRLLSTLKPAGRPTGLTLRWSWTEQQPLLLLEGGQRRDTVRLCAELIDLVPEVSWHHGRQVEVLRGRGFFHETLADRPLRVSPTSFFQVNVPQARRLWQTVRTLLEPQPEDHLLDAYAGVGALSLPLAGTVRQVTAVEAHPAAAADLCANAHQGAGTIEVLAGLVEHVLPAHGGSCDLAILDPPRRGCAPAALEAILAGRPRRIVYVSCHPGTLARDVRILTAGGYQLQSIQPVDMFPQTSHVESVALLIPASISG